MPQLSKNYSIHRILNIFETYLKRKRISTTIQYTLQNHIVIFAMYAKNQPINETNATLDWLKQNKHRQANCYISITLTPTTTYDASKKVRKLIMYGISINENTCPDQNLAQELQAAITAFQNDYDVTTFNVLLSQKLLNQARKKAIKDLHQTFEYIIEHTNLKNANKYNKDNYLTFLNTVIYEMHDQLELTRYLYLGPYGCGNDELDNLFLQQKINFSFAHDVDNPDFGIYKKTNTKKSQTGEIT